MFFLVREWLSLTVFRFMSDTHFLDCHLYFYNNFVLKHKQEHKQECLWIDVI